MSLYQRGPPRPRVKASLSPAPVLATGFALVKAEEPLLGVKSRRVMEALIAFGGVILPMFAMIALLFLLSSDHPTTVIGALDGTGMLILPP